MRYASQSGPKNGSAVARQARGASVVELLIVVAILLVILAIALPRLVAARATAQEASAVVFLRNLHAAQEQYYMVHGTYAATFAELEGYLASNGAGPQPRYFPVGLTPLRNDSMPTLAFLLLPAAAVPEQSTYASNGPKRPEGEDERSGGGGAGSGDSAGGGGSNPPGKGNDNSGPGGGQGSGSGSDDGANPEQGGSPSGGKPGGSQGGVWSKADRKTYQGYEFYLLRPNAHSWNCLAMPVRNEHSGHHYFADQTGTIRREFGKPASAQSPAL